MHLRTNPWRIANAEPGFGADFSAARIHTGEAAAQHSANLNAHAFTVGEHVFFGRNQFQPESSGA